MSKHLPEKLNEGFVYKQSAYILYVYIIYIKYLMQII